MSLHAQSGYETVTPGIYARLADGITVGTYHNSIRRQSTYAGYTFETENKRFALTVGGVTGYESRSVLPLVVPSMRIGLSDSVSARLAYVPKPPSHYGSGTQCLHIALERSF